MDFNEIITFITNNGIAVVLMVYFLRNNFKSTQELLKQNKELITEIKEMRADQKEMIRVIQNCELRNKAS
ncbi:MAG: hypothetical protein ACFFDH_00495 [Promethearchaeota archaeon]